MAIALVPQAAATSNLGFVSVQVHALNTTVPISPAAALATETTSSAVSLDWVTPLGLIHVEDLRIAIGRLIHALGAELLVSHPWFLMVLSP